MPFFLYANPELLKYNLEPLFQNQEGGFYPNGYSMHDLVGGSIAVIGMDTNITHRVQIIPMLPGMWQATMNTCLLKNLEL